MPEPPVVAALTVLAVVGYGGYRLHRLRRALIAERASRRLTEQMRYRDFEALSDRLNAAVYATQILSEADLVLDTALATHYPEGGPR
ncbi:hypothetical protein [Streptomyces sp. NBC_00847]|uniref:hypothetical protein n=1 Tax=Streptomyces sp. NBC_00847 TaxID=2975850 RepID=UPI00225E3488|nr:hypothetical protein [Streptomyces sp. NBC_00847]MCX4885957.1 hypothetical protein [Streptomyces sp. NBC_00847]